MTAAHARRIAQLERALWPSPSGPAFIMAPSRSAADRQIEQLQAEHGERMPRTMFVMICPRPELER